MYKVLKGRGGDANIIIQNSDTAETVIIGRVTVSILNTLLKEEGYTTDPSDPSKYIEIREPWDLEISESTAKELARIAMPMHRPARKKAEQKEEKPKKKAPVDVFNLIFGVEE